MNREIARDVVAVVGFVAVVVGVWWLSPAWSMIVGGGLVLAALRWPGRSPAVDPDEEDLGDAVG